MTMIFFINDFNAAGRAVAEKIEFGYDAKA
jgi:hypothetical protein